MEIPSHDSFAEARLSQSSGSDTTASGATTSDPHPVVIVLLAVLSSFAVGSIPVIYAFTQAHNQAQTTTSTPIIRGEMF